MCVGHHYARLNTNNVNKTLALLQTTGGKTNQTSFSCGNPNGYHNSELIDTKEDPDKTNHTTNTEVMKKKIDGHNPTMPVSTNSHNAVEHE
jgi:hypothetical protein